MILILIKKTRRARARGRALSDTIHSNVVAGACPCPARSTRQFGPSASGRTFHYTLAYLGACAVGREGVREVRDDSSR